MKPIHLDCTTISDAWFQLVYNILEPAGAYIQNIQRGSFENSEYRIQYPGASFCISQPWVDMYPQVPKHLEIPNPTDEEYVTDYFVNYIMGTELAENETYTYGSRINEKVPRCKWEDEIFYSGWDGKTQLDAIIKMLKETPLTNHAIIEIAQPTDITACIGKDNKNDPPCLRLIDFKVIPSDCPECKGKGHFLPNGQIYVKCDRCNETGTIMTLTVSVYFRSWDLWAGLPSNLAAIEMLKQHVSGECNLENGSMYCYSSGLHLYGYQEEIAKIRTLKN